MKEQDKPDPVLGGFPWHCFDTCETPDDCVMDGCKKTKPLFATPEDRMLMRPQRNLTDEERERSIGLYMVLQKYIGRDNTPELRKEIVDDLLDLAARSKSDGRA